MRRVLCTVLAFGLLASSASAQMVLPERLQIAATTRLFEQMRSTPGFNLAKPATFGYFFKAVSAESLVPIRRTLEGEGYVFVETHVDKKGKTWIQLAKDEIHTPDSMVERNRRLLFLATQQSDVDYDGWDVTRSEP